QRCVLKDLLSVCLTHDERQDKFINPLGMTGKQPQEFVVLSLTVFQVFHHANRLCSGWEQLSLLFAPGTECNSPTICSHLHFVSNSGNFARKMQFLLPHVLARSKQTLFAHRHDLGQPNSWQNTKKGDFARK